MARAARLALPALVLALVLLAPSAATAKSRSFDGRCDIAGPIEPATPINVFPRPGARFSFHGRGTCSGTINGKPRDQLRARLDVVDAQTLFDTCQLGPDLGVPVWLSVRRARRRWSRFALTLEMPRVATLGPFVLHGAGGGLAHGLAQLIPPDIEEALAACGDPEGGIATAELTASLQTIRPLTGI